MNETSSDPDALMQAAPENLASPVFQRIVLAAFSRMTRGYLRIELPDGEYFEVGKSGAETSALILVRNPEFFKKCVFFGDVGFGEAYVDGDWETDSIERVISWAILNSVGTSGTSGSKQRGGFVNVFELLNRVRHWLRPNSLRTSRRNIAEHYDLGNDFYRLWLDTSMTYSSAYFTDKDQSLESAQYEKYDALCRNLKMRATDHVLEIGTGWGGFCTHAARKYGCRVTTVTISEQQFAFAKARVEAEGLANLVDVQLMDYRKIQGSFSKIVSIEMMEALGDRYLETYCAKIHEVLAPGGLVGLQYITVPDNRHAELRRGVDWIQKHIFPGSLLLSVGRVNQALNRTGDLFLHRLEDIGSSYAKTLQMWWTQFNASKEALEAMGFRERFMRKWNYYLQYCEAAFNSRHISVVQAFYTRPNNPILRGEF
ncbi:MAG: cyclopropane-fatty-acyl-phospholipid synthase family protein [Verrucomicrobiota bacterium]